MEASMLEWVSLDIPIILFACRNSILALSVDILWIDISSDFTVAAAEELTACRFTIYKA